MKLTEERTARASELEMELQASRQVAEKATVDCSEARVQLTEQQVRPRSAPLAVQNSL